MVLEGEEDSGCCPFWDNLSDIFYFKTSSQEVLYEKLFEKDD